MRLNIKSSAGADHRAWTMVKVVTLLVVLSFLLTPLGKEAGQFATSEASTVLAARIVSSDMVEVSPDAAAVVKAVYVRTGDTVEAGQLLAELESEDLRTERERAALRVELAAQSLGQPGGGQSLQRRLLEEQGRAAQAALEASRRRVAEHSLAPLEAAYRQAEVQAEQVKRLASQQLATAVEVAAAERQVEMERRNLEAGREQRLRLEEELAARESQWRQVRLQLEAENSGGVGRLAQLNYQDAVSALRAIEERQGRLALRAPRAGRILQAGAHAGSRVAAGEVLFRVADLSRLHFEVPVTGKIARQIAEGDPVFVLVPKDPPVRVAAAVSEVTLAPNQTHQSYVIRVTIPNPDPDAVLVGLEGAVEFPHLEKSWSEPS